MKKVANKSSKQPNTFDEMRRSISAQIREIENKIKDLDTPSGDLGRAS